MLVLSRKPGEQIVIGNDIRITLVEVRGNRIKIGIEAPDDVAVFRSELRDWVNDPVPAKPPAAPSRRLRHHKAKVPVSAACAMV